MQTNITTNDLATKINECKIDNDKKLNADANKSQLYEFVYNYSLSKNTDYLVLKQVIIKMNFLLKDFQILLAQI